MTQQEFDWTTAIRLIVTGLVLIIFAVQGKLSLEGLVLFLNGMLLPTSPTVNAIKDKLS